MSKGLTPEGSEAEPPIALVDPDQIKGTEPAPALEPAVAAPPSDIAPAPDAVPVDPVTGMPLPTQQPAAPPPPADEGPLLSTGSSDQLMNHPEGESSGGDQVLIPTGEDGTPAPQ